MFYNDIDSSSPRRFLPFWQDRGALRDSGKDLRETLCQDDRTAGTSLSCGGTPQHRNAPIRARRSGRGPRFPPGIESVSARRPLAQTPGRAHRRRPGIHLFAGLWAGSGQGAGTGRGIGSCLSAVQPDRVPHLRQQHPIGTALAAGPETTTGTTGAIAKHAMTQAGFGINHYPQPALPPDSTFRKNRTPARQETQSPRSSPESG